MSSREINNKIEDVESALAELKSFLERGSVRARPQAEVLIRRAVELAIAIAVDRYIKTRERDA